MGRGRSPGPHMGLRWDSSSHRVERTAEAGVSRGWEGRELLSCLQEPSTHAWAGSAGTPTAGILGQGWAPRKLGQRFPAQAAAASPPPPPCKPPGDLQARPPPPIQTPALRGQSPRDQRLGPFSRTHAPLSHQGLPKPLAECRAVSSHLIPRETCGKIYPSLYRWRTKTETGMA